MHVDHHVEFNKRFCQQSSWSLLVHTTPYPQEEKKQPAQEPQGAELIDSVLDVVRKEAEGGRHDFWEWNSTWLVLSAVGQSRLRMLRAGFVC